MTLIYGLYSYSYYVLFPSFPSLDIKIEMPVNIRSSLLDRMINIHRPSCNPFLFFPKRKVDAMVYEIKLKERTKI